MHTRGKNNLYSYQGSSSIIVLGAVVSKGKDSDANRLWHMRFGRARDNSFAYSGERRLIERCKDLQFGFL